MNDKFKAVLISEKSDKSFKREIVSRDIEDLPQGDLLIKVKYYIYM